MTASGLVHGVLVALAACALACASHTESNTRAEPTSAHAAAASPGTAPTSPADERMRVRVDARVELLCIVNRLAGAPEYRMGHATPYRAAVDAHFAALGEHAAVTMTRALRASHGISFNAPVGLAVYLDPQTLEPRVPLEPVPASLDQRWNGAPLGEYLAALRDFAAASGFAEFMAGQAEYTGAVETAFRALVDDAGVVAWFDATLGERAGAWFIVVPGLLTGGANYGATVDLADGAEEIYQIVMLEDPDAQGVPHPRTATLDLLVHEMAHAYVNPVIERHAAELAEPGARLFPGVAERMSRMAYTSWEIVAKESVVRALTILFIRARRGEDAARAATRAEIERGFVWMDGLVQVLDARLQGADAPATLERAMPAVAEFFAHLAAPPQAEIGP